MTCVPESTCKNTRRLHLRGIILLCINIVGSSTVHSNSWMRKSSTETTYGVRVFTKQVGPDPDCPITCYKHPTCQIFTFSMLSETCTGYSAFATHYVQGVSSQMLDYFLPADTTVYTLDTVLNVTFAVYKVRKNWHNAKKVCASDGARLISFDNKIKTNISTHIDTGRYWIGLSQIASEEAWIWENGRLFDGGEWSYLFNDYDGTAHGSDRNKADCTAWESSVSHFNDYNCAATKMYFICEKY